MGDLSPQIAAQELLKRRSIRKSLTEWARHNGFEPAPHHQLFISEIEAFLKSEDEVLLLFAPPGSAKSTYVSVLLPSWYLAANPTHSILAATHNVEFAERWGRRVRNDIAADANVLGISLSEDSKAAARWSLTTSGEYHGVGAGGTGWTGSGAAQCRNVAARRAPVRSGGRLEEGGDERICGRDKRRSGGHRPVPHVLAR